MVHLVCKGHGSLMLNLVIIFRWMVMMSYFVTGMQIEVGKSICMWRNRISISFGCLYSHLWFSPNLFTEELECICYCLIGNWEEFYFIGGINIDLFKLQDTATEIFNTLLVNSNFYQVSIGNKVIFTRNHNCS